MKNIEVAAAPLHIAVNGCTGRIGLLLIEEILSGAWGGQLKLAGGMCRKPGNLHADYFVTGDAEALLAKSNAVIDFTNPDTTAKTVWLAAKHKIPYVTGTTGLNAAQEKELQDAAREIPIVYAANMSVGVTLLAALVEQAAAKLGPEWDVEILETHHRNKIDAPSGTALMLGRSVRNGRQPSPNLLPEGRGLNPLSLQGEGWGEGLTDRTGKREPGSIGFAVRRGGDVVGEHTVGFYGAGERIELSHTATDRRLFARGAIRAALWVARQPPGLYTMRDVLGL